MDCSTGFRTSSATNKSRDKQNMSASSLFSSSNTAGSTSISIWWATSTRRKPFTICGFSSDRIKMGCKHPILFMESCSDPMDRPHEIRNRSSAKFHRFVWIYLKFINFIQRHLIPYWPSQANALFKVLHHTLLYVDSFNQILHHNRRKHISHAGWNSSKNNSQIHSYQLTSQSKALRQLQHSLERANFLQIDQYSRGFWLEVM